MSQRGWLTKEERKKHGKVWVFHWYKVRPSDGKKVENTAVVGRVASFSKESSAWEEVERRGLNHNIDEPDFQTGLITFGELAHSYEQHAVPKLDCTTQKTVRHIIDDYLVPRWGKQAALNIRALDIETWLSSLPLANPTKDKLRRTMFRVYFKAQKHGLIPCKEETNPVNWVEQSGKSHYKAVIVTPEQAFKIMMALPESERVLTLVIAATGLRISEALGLQWQDVDYANQRINLRRVWVDNKVVERMKTEQSEAPATMSPTLAEVLKCWHQQTPYGQPGGWICASSRLKGRQPRTASILAADHLRPAAIAAGVVLKAGQRFGFHNLRHSLATFLINKEKDTKTVQGLLRHANVSTTLGLYAQSVNSSMVEAQESMLNAILRNGSNAVN
jgi:integrase